MWIAKAIAIMVLTGLVVAPLIGAWVRHARRAQGRHFEPEDIGTDAPATYAFRIHDVDTGREWRIYEDGQVEGWEGQSIIISNRIPLLVATAAQLGYSEAESYIIRGGAGSGRKQEG